MEHALYHGDVLHRRLRPARHRLRYRVFHLLLDIDRIDDLAARLRLFSHNRFNLFSFHDADHGSIGQTPRTPLRAHAENLLRAAGIEPDGGPIQILTMPRLLGYAFNPLNTWFCHGTDGALRAVIYEVSNTFGERHNYVIPARPGARTLHQFAPKSFHVSPFLPMAMDYAFRVLPPEEKLALGITVSDDKGPILAAIHTAHKTALTDRSLLKTALTYPLATLKVTAGIHWEALKLWRKRVPLFRKPAPPNEAVTIGR
ncbi:MAG: hypothetical protein B7Y36_17610 [Novosphingobium sp. 28-62-57]|uniref:DUF1365 domain-containing protein n=1 Tax=unclassified Novosphingobium TaxID=2644732 RepID=UPI000BC3EFE4|nr:MULTISPECIES: DUF1365 family protein [unclassified Novosphingobium]OYW48717.1 MAG: hypothetical protein B7Z34_12515 [Novosphingobium sp. 12-62-10]OYZ08297.1 MAG: hypothetical protein B7Y36_17610 [Novosphingobium sp. 28-62-57]OZA35855.1 MAG: hypothetical protein B7X92_08655 [Novosphingobium sp. 17-62-9]HQS69406.1 DUF1365 family protein [Novosphingobium sp.]